MDHLRCQTKTNKWLYIAEIAVLTDSIGDEEIKEYFAKNLTKMSHKQAMEMLQYATICQF